MLATMGLNSGKIEAKILLIYCLLNLVIKTVNVFTDSFIKLDALGDVSA